MSKIPDHMSLRVGKAGRMMSLVRPAANSSMVASSKEAMRRRLWNAETSGYLTKRKTILAKANDLGLERQYLIGPVAVISEAVSCLHTTWKFSLSRPGAAKRPIVFYDVPDVFLGSTPLQIRYMVVGPAEIPVVDLLPREGQANERGSHKPMDAMDFAYATLKKVNPNIALTVIPVGQYVAFSILDLPT